jgi:hypothetical protein
MATEYNLPRSRSLTEIARACVCVCAEEGVVCCVRVHASVYALLVLNAAWAGGVPEAHLTTSATSRPPYMRPEVKAITFSQDLSLGAPS